MLALEDEVNLESPYNSGFNVTLESEDKNFDGQSVPDFEVTVEDNDEGIISNLIDTCTCMCVMVGLIVSMTVMAQ